MTFSAVCNYSTEMLLWNKLHFYEINVIYSCWFVCDEIFKRPLAVQTNAYQQYRFHCGYSFVTQIDTANFFPVIDFSQNLQWITRMITRVRWRSIYGYSFYFRKLFGKSCQHERKRVYEQHITGNGTGNAVNISHNL